MFTATHLINCISCEGVKFETVIKFLTLHTFSKKLPTHIFKKITGALFGKIFLTKTIDFYAKNSAKHDRRGFESISTQ